MPNVTTNHAITYTNTNEMTSHMKNLKKKNLSTQNTGMEHYHRISTYGNRRQSVLSRKKEKTTSAG